MPGDEDHETTEEQIGDFSSPAEPVPIDTIIELSRKVKEGLRSLIPDWQSRGLLDDQWLRAYEASLEDPMRPPPPPPMIRRGKCDDCG